MIIQAAYHDGPPRRLAAEKLSRPKCPRCGSALLVAEQSRFNVRGRIDHAWSCDDRGHAFATTITMWPH